MHASLRSFIRSVGIPAVLALSACSGGGGGGGGGEPNIYYHFICNGDSECLTLNPFPSGTPSGTSNQGSGAGGQANCNSLMTFGNKFWNIPPAQQWCDTTPDFSASPFPTVSMSVSPSTVVVGQSATVTWSSVNTNSCTAGGAWTGAKATSGSQSVTPSSNGLQSYQLTCDGPSGRALGAANLTVKAAPATVNLTVTPASIMLGQQAQLTWSSQNIDNCTASGPWSGAKGASGNQMVTPASAGSFAYTLSCVGYRGTATRTVTLTVAPNGGPAAPAAPTASISATVASPSCVDLGSTSTLSWSSTNATSCAASGAWTGATALSGSKLLYPAADGNAYTADQQYDYVLSCTGPGGTASSVATVCANKSTSNSPAVIVNVTAVPSGIALGESTTITWSSQYAATCVAADAWSGVLPLSGSTIITPSSSGAFAYTVRCSRNTTVTAASATVSVQVASGTDPLAARFCNPDALAMNASDDLYVSDTDNFTIRKIAQNGTVSTVAGLAAAGGGEDGVGAAARFYYARGIAAGAAGNVYVANSAFMSMRKIAPDATVTTPAGFASTTNGFVNGTGSTARFFSPFGLVADASENTYIADFGNHAIRKMTPGGTVTTIAGAGPSGIGYADGPAASATFYQPTGVALVGSDLYVADQGNYTIRKIASDGTVSTFAGTRGTGGLVNGTGTAAQFLSIHAIASDASGNLFVTDNGQIRKITTPGAVVTTFAPLSGSPANGSGIATDSLGNVYATDSNSILKITPAGVVSTYAGNFNTCGSNN